MHPESFVGHKIYFVASGAGTSFQDQLWMVPGTSSFLVGAAFPYAMEATGEFLGFKPEKYCSREEALQLAMEAFMRAASVPGGKPIGLALTATVSSCNGPPHRGDHRVFVAIVTAETSYVLKVVLDKNPGCGETARKRDNDSAALAAEDLLRIVLGEWTFEEAVEANLRSPGFARRCEIDRVKDDELLEIFFKHPFFGQSGARGAQEPAETEVFYPGTFNPLHDGHRTIVRNVGTSDVCYTVNVDGPHKGTMAPGQMLAIAAQFRRERLQWHPASVLFTRGEPLFVDKFKARPEKTFVVGVDTFERMLDPKWGVDPLQVLKSIYDNTITLFVCDRIVDGVRKSAHGAIERLVPRGEVPLKHTYIQAIDVEPSALLSSAIRAAAGA